MWMLSFVPDAWLYLAVLSVLGLGAALYAFSYFTAFVPELILFKEPIRILGTVLAIAGMFFYSSYDTEEMWRNRVAEVEAKVAQAEAESKQANDKLAKKGADRVRVIKERGLVVKQYIDREVVKYDDSCKIPDVVVKAHNAAARNEEIK
jgi:DNA-binding protein YbaB